MREGFTVVQRIDLDCEARIAVLGPAHRLFHLQSLPLQNSGTGVERDQRFHLVPGKPGFIRESDLSSFHSRAPAGSRSQ